MVFGATEAAHEEANGRLRADAADVGIDLGELASSPVWSMALPDAPCPDAVAAPDPSLAVVVRSTCHGTAGPRN